MGVLMRSDDPLAAREDIRAEDLQGASMIMPKGSLVRRDLSGWYGADLRPYHVVGSMNLTYNASRFVRAGYGYAMSLGGLVDAGEGSGLCFRPLDPPVHIALHMAWKKNQPLTPAAQAFLTCVREVVAKKAEG